MDGQSYLLLIRDEGGPPELQVMPLPPALAFGAPFLRFPVGTGQGCVWGEGYAVRPCPGEGGNCARSPLVCCLGGRGGVCVQPGG